MTKLLRSRRRSFGIALSLCFAATTAPNRADAALSYNIEGASGWPSQSHFNAAVGAIESTLARFNAYAPNGFGNYNVHLRHDNGVPTAQASYLGSIQFGNTFPNERVMMHELAHYLGSGTFGDPWDGVHGEALIDQFEGLEAQLNGDAVHFWPYGLNFDSEGSEINKQRHVAMIYAQRADMGLGPSAHPSTATTVTLTGSDPFNTSGFNYQDGWSDGYFAHAGADYFTDDFLMRTPNSPNSFTFVGDSLTINNTSGINGGLIYKGSGTTGITKINNLTIDGGYVRNDSDSGGHFQLDGSATIIGNTTFHAETGDIAIMAPLSGTGSLNLLGNRTIALLDESNSYAGVTAVAGGTHLVVDGATGLGATTLARGAMLSGGGTVRGHLSASLGTHIRVGGEGIPTQASQLVIDDFSSYSTGSVRNVADPPWNAHGGTQFVAIENFIGDNVLTYGWSSQNRGTSRPVPAAASFGDDQIATLFFRANSKSDDPDHSFGLGDQVNTGGVDFPDFEAQVRLRSDTAGVYAIDARDGGSFTSTLATGLSPNSWYNFWMVIDQTTDTYDIYMNTGTADASGAHQIASGLNFRNGTTDSLNQLLGYAGPGGVDFGVRIDDITYLQGMDLSNPLAGLNPTLEFLPETLTVDGNADLLSGSILALDIVDTSTHDVLSVGGNLQMSGALQVTLDAAAPAPQLGDVFQLLSFGSATGSFESFALPALADGLAWNATNLLTSGELEVVEDVDRNDDGFVNGQDLLLLQSENPGRISVWETFYGSQLVIPPPEFLVTVPEPNAATLLLVLAITVGRVRSCCK